eukprot:g29161.t1
MQGAKNNDNQPGLVIEEKVRVPSDALATSCLRFGSSFAFAHLEAEEKEEIYQDELEDGLSECAQEQAKVWSEAVRTGEDTAGVDAAFLQELQKLFQQAQPKAGKARAQPAFQDEAASHAGVFSASVRLQPRFEAGAATKFDLRSRVRTAQELQAIKSSNKEYLQARFAALSLPEEKQEAATNSGRVQSVSQEKLEGELDQVVVMVNEAMVQCGFAGQDLPCAIFPAIVGRPRHKGVMVGMGQKDAYVGDEAQSKRGILTMKYPVEAGVVVNWDDMEKLWHHAFYNELRVAPEEHPVLLSEPVCNPVANRQKLCQIMFETFNVPALCLKSSAQLVLAATGQTSGLVVEVGERITTVAAVRGRQVIPESAMSLSIGNRDLVDFLGKLLTEAGYSFTTTAERDIVTHIRTSLAYAAPDFASELQKDAGSSESYEMPDGQCIQVKTERFRCVEPLFAPSLLGRDEYGLDLLVASAVSACPAPSRRGLWQHVVLSSDIKGLGVRLQTELTKCLPQGANLKVTQLMDRQAAWRGGSLLASCYPQSWGFTSQTISKAEYDQLGPEVIFRCEGAVSRTNPFAFPCPTDRTGPSDDSSLLASPTPQEGVPEAKRSNAQAVCEAVAPAVQNLDKQAKEVKTKETKAKKVETLSRPLPNCNILHVPMSGLLTRLPTASMTKQGDGEPVRCEACHAYMTSNSQVDHTAFTWSCELCQHKNMAMLEPGQEPAAALDVLEYLESPPTAAQMQGRLTTMADEDSLVVFCLDNSGSMSETVPTDGAKVPLPASIRRSHPTGATRMECLQAAVHSQLKLIAELYPSRRPVLISFCSDVRVYFGAAGGVVQIPNVDRDSFEELFEQGKRLASCHKLQAAKDCAERLTSVVDGLRPESMTALGPAVSVALGIAAQCVGSKNILCTDGLANCGVGSLGRGKETKDFYNELGRKARELSTEISVLTIRGTDCEMEMIGVPAAMTRGSVDVVNPLNVSEHFAHLLSRRALATGVSGRVRLDSAWRFLHGNEFELGSVTADSDLLFPLECIPAHVPAGEKRSKSLVAQLELRYTRADGAVCIRVVTRRLPISHSRDECEKTLNSPLLATAAIQAAADYAQQGRYLDARCVLISHMRLLQRAMRTREQQQCYIAYIRQGERLDGFMRITQERERVLGDEQSKRDDTAARNIMQMKTAAVSSFTSAA